jgi:hypothetical protein
LGPGTFLSLGTFETRQNLASVVQWRRADPAVLLLVALALAGCGGDDEPDAEAAAATTAVEAQPVSACTPADSSLMTPLGNGMKDMTHRLKNGQAVESEDHEDVYFVSAEVYGEGIETGTIGTWATTSLGGAEAIYSVDDVARDYSDMRDGTEEADLSMDDHGVAESRDCVDATGLGLLAALAWGPAKDSAKKR